MKNKQQLGTLYLRAILQKNAPFDTGNLALNSIRAVQDEIGFKVVIGGEIAPYAKFTNAKPPNKGWIQNSIDEAIPYIRQIFSGALTEKEIRESVDNVRNDFEEQVRNRVSD